MLFALVQDLLYRHQLFTLLHVVDHYVSLWKGSTLDILAGQSHPISLVEQRSKSQGLRRCPFDRWPLCHRFLPLRVNLRNRVVRIECFRNSVDEIADHLKRFLRHPCFVHFTVDQRNDYLIRGLALPFRKFEAFALPTGGCFLLFIVLCDDLLLLARYILAIDHFFLFQLLAVGFQSMVFGLSKFKRMINNNNTFA